MKALKKGKVYQSRGKRSHFSFWHGKGIKDTFKLNVEMTALPWEQRAFHTEVGKGCPHEGSVCL